MKRRIDVIIEQMALWAEDYRSPECHDSDLVAKLGDYELTVGCLRWAFARYYGVPFKFKETPCQRTKKPNESALG